MTRLIVLALALHGCSQTKESLESSKGAVRAEKQYSVGYQEVYRRLGNTAARCLAHGGSASFVVDKELYNDLGFGEVSFSMASIYGRNYYWSAKIEKNGTGAKLSVYSGNTLAKDRHINDVLRWADGDQGC